MTPEYSRKAPQRPPYLAEADRRSKAIQTLLGDHQDSVVSREHLLAAAEAAHAAGEDTFTYGVLYEREAEVASYCEHQLMDIEPGGTLLRCPPN